MFCTYALYNEARDKIYIGHTADLDIRLKRHNKQLPTNSKSFTSKNDGEWILVHKEEFASRQEAMIREKQLKSAKGREFIRNKINNKK